MGLFDNDVLDNPTDIIEKVEIKRDIPVGPFKIKMEVCKKCKLRLKDKAYNLLPGDYIDGSMIDRKKLDILINTRYLNRC